MPRFDDDESASVPAQPPIAPRGREDLLDALSIEEIDEKIAALRQEIERLEAKRSAKEASRCAADAFFKR